MSEVRGRTSECEPGTTSAGLRDVWKEVGWESWLNPPAKEDLGCQAPGEPLQGAPYCLTVGCCNEHSTAWSAGGWTHIWYLLSTPFLAFTRRFLSPGLVESLERERKLSAASADEGTVTVHFSWPLDWAQGLR